MQSGLEALKRLTFFLFFFTKIQYKVNRPKNIKTTLMNLITHIQRQGTGECGRGKSRNRGARVQTDKTNKNVKK